MHDDPAITLGWREWIGLPDLGIRQLKAKVDTGARTSALHAFDIRPYSADGQERVEFLLHPKQRNTETIVRCHADIIDQRLVSDSGGHREQRFVIQTTLNLGTHSWPIEVTLTARDDMRFRMLLGRAAIKGLATVDPSRSYLVGKRKRKKRTQK